MTLSYNPLLDLPRDPLRLTCQLTGGSLEHAQCLKRWQDGECGECTVGAFLHDAMVRRLARQHHEETCQPFRLGRPPKVRTCPMCGREFVPDYFRSKLCGRDGCRSAWSRTTAGKSGRRGGKFTGKEDR